MSDEALLDARVVHREDLAEGLCVLRVAPDGRPAPPFEPGQYVRVGLPSTAPPPEEGGDERRALVRRAYSIASAASERRWLELLVARVPGGRLTTPLWHLGEAERLWLDRAAHGRFTLRLAPPEAELVLVATGTGIAPFASMLRTYRGTGRWRRLVLVHGVRRTGELAYREELDVASREDPTIAYVPIVSREPEASSWRGLRGRVQLVLEAEGFRRLLGAPLDPERAHVFLCGNPAMIAGVSADLTARGFRPARPGLPGNLHFERFW